MTQQLAYLVTAVLKPDSARDPECDPRAEYAVFAQRNDVTFLDYGLFAQRFPAFYRALERRHLRHCGLPFVAVPERSRFRGLVVSGEDSGLPLMALSKLLRYRRPIYVITHGSYFGSDKYRKIIARTRNMAHVHHLCLSESLRRTMIDRFGLAPANVHNTGYGIDTRFFHPHESPELSKQEHDGGGEGARPVIASAGAAHRDYATLVKASVGLNSDVRIAADSAWFPGYIQMAKEDLPPNVEARSYGNYLGLRDLYARAAFVVVPLHPAKHACGYAVIGEAMAMGKAVIATRTDHPSDFLVEGENGYYVEPGDVDGLRRRMAELLADPDRARAMGRRARERMEREFSIEAYCAKMEQVIGENGLS